MERIELLASIPAIQSAIRMGGDGARVTFEVPESEMPQFLKLVAFGRNKVLRIIVDDPSEKRPSPTEVCEEHFCRKGECGCHLVD